MERLSHKHVKTLKDSLRSKGSEGEENSVQVETKAAEPPAKAAPSRGPKRPTFEEKQDLAEKVKSLGRDGLTKMVEIIMEMCYGAIDDVETNRIHIRIDDLDIETFDCVFKHVVSMLPETQELEPPLKRQKT